MDSLLPDLFEITKGGLMALHATDEELVPLAARRDQRSWVEVALAPLHICRAVPPSMEIFTRLVQATDADEGDQTGVRY